VKIHLTRKHYNLTFGYSLVLIFAITLAAVQGIASGAQSLSSSPISIKNFGKLNNELYRGSQPNAEQFVELKRLGVKTVVDLRKDRVDEAAGWAYGAGLHYVNIPLTTKRAPTGEQTAYFLTVVKDPANWPIFVHCKGGRHRTGEMAAIYRITHDGWTADQAYEEMKKYDFEDSFFYPRSLKKYVFSYYERFASQQASKPQSVTTSH
jgi:tyrosine-protein phosphatase SIW14